METVQTVQTVHHHHVLNTQTSTESGWDNPFRPEGDLSREADEIVNLIRDGKPITPTGDYNHTIVNGVVERKEVSEIAATALTAAKISSEPKKDIKKEQQTQNQSAQNGKKSSTKTMNDNKAPNEPKTPSSATTTKVSNTTVPGPASASYVTIEEKKNKKCNCCTIQ